MRAEDLIKVFKQMYDEKWAYVANGSQAGSVDCSGAFVYAFKKFGQSIYHGSNTIARQYVSAPLSKIASARPGYAAFKWREANDSTPAKYRNDGLGDFYHIGLVSEDGKHVYNAKDEAHGFCLDDLSKWHFVAPLKGVTYEGGENVANQVRLAQVVLKSGYLNIRNAPNGSVVGKVENGDMVTVYEEIVSSSKYWSRIGPDMWVSSDYLVTKSSNSETSSNSSFKITDSKGNVFYPVGDFTVTTDNSID